MQKLLSESKLTTDRKDPNRLITRKGAQVEAPNLQLAKQND